MNCVVFQDFTPFASNCAGCYFCPFWSHLFSNSCFKILTFAANEKRKKRRFFFFLVLVLGLPFFFTDSDGFVPVTITLAPKRASVSEPETLGVRISQSSAPPFCFCGSVTSFCPRATIFLFLLEIVKKT